MPSYAPDADIFSYEHEPRTCLLNPTNAVGPMGAGLAKAFAQRYAGLADAYSKACKEGKVAAGGIYPIRIDPAQMQISPDGELIVVNIATKDHWRDPSRIEWVQQGMRSLAHRVDPTLVQQVIVPQLGCGLGGLQWPDVARAIAPAVAAIKSKGIDVILCGPDPALSKKPTEPPGPGGMFT